MQTSRSAITTGRANWRGPALAKTQEWVRPFTPAEIAELDAALRGVQARGLGIGDLRREDFPLPTLAAVLQGVLLEIEEGRGFQLLRGFPVDRYTLDEQRMIYWGIGLHMGTAMPQSRRNDFLGDVCDLKIDYNGPRGRGYTSNAQLSYHTDAADVSALFCLRQSKSGGLSLIASSVEVHNEMLRRRPDLLEVLYRPLPFSRQGDEAPGDARWYQAPVFTVHDGHFASRFVRGHVRGIAFIPEAPQVTAEQEAAMDLLEAIASDPDFVLSFTMEPGDIQFMNSHVTYHNRTAFEDWPEPARRRHMLRLWLSVPNSRPLSPAFAPVYRDQRAGAVRGGIRCADVPPRFSTLEAA